MLTGELCWAPTRFSLAKILVLVDTAGAGGMAPPTSTRISAWLKRAQEREYVGVRTEVEDRRCGYKPA